tara:strand:+ start:426 stop:704 length:279 start_codon:yes stop_codon:yes gene_type:complete
MMTSELSLFSYILISFLFVGICFIFIGVGILFFGRKDIGSECGTVPNHETNACLSQEMGLCPMDDQEGYLKMATSASRLKTNLDHDHKRNSS